MVDYRRFCEVYHARIQNGAFVEDRDYYRQLRDRYWNTFRYVERMLPAGGARVLDVGSGQFAILANHLLGAKADVADLDKAPPSASSASATSSGCKTCCMASAGPVRQHWRPSPRLPFHLLLVETKEPGQRRSPRAPLRILPLDLRTIT